MRNWNNQLRAVFDDPAPPDQISEYQFDGFDDELRQLAHTPWDRIEEVDLWYYLHDLAYVELQPDLFNYLFPVCLNFWYTTLIRNTACAVGDAEFHYALFRGRVLEKMLTLAQRGPIFDLFHEGFLERINQERGFVYRAADTPAYGWMMRFNSLGLVTPLIERIWNTWWQLTTCGQAVCALMYLSGLMYPIGENPIFGTWTEEKGGGGPYLWENDSNIFDQGWRPENLAFMRRVLTVDYFAQKVEAAREQLADEPEAEMANRICKNYKQLSWAVEIRIEYLLERLESPKSVYFDW